MIACCSRVVLSCCWIGVLVATDLRQTASAFQTPRRMRQSARTATFLEAKKMRNNQAELAAKMAEAKRQNPDEPGKRLSDEQVKEQNDRKRFEDLLQRQSASLNSLSSDGYLSKDQEEAEIDAYQRGLALLFEGDPAPSLPFHDLVSIMTENALGEVGTKRLLPWLKKTNANDFLVVVCDPRVKSPQLRETVGILNTGLPKEILNRMVVVNADTPAENRRWLKKVGIGSVQILSDEKREWMRAYTALGENRWSTTVFVLADERLQKVARDVESVVAVKTIRNAVQAMESRRL